MYKKTRLLTEEQLERRRECDRRRHAAWSAEQHENNKEYHRQYYLKHRIEIVFTQEEREAIKENQRQEGKYMDEIGKQCEEFIRDLLLSTNRFLDVEILGYMNGSADLQILLRSNEVRYIQIKRLTRSGAKYPNQYQSRPVNQYEDNMLVVLVNIENEKYVIGHAKDFKNGAKSTLCITLNCSRSKYVSNICKNLDDLVSRMIDMIPASSCINHLSKSNQKEFDMRSRLEEYCRNNNLEYKNNVTNNNTIDCYINGRSCQLKFRSSPNVSSRSICYKIGVHKYGGRLNGVRQYIPYSKDDFDYFIVEVGYHIGQFCCIEMSKLIRYDIIKSINQPGTKSISLCPPDYTKPHRFLSDWNTIVSKLTYIPMDDRAIMTEQQIRLLNEVVCLDEEEEPIVKRQRIS